jgi:hypothetical protein
MERRTRLAAIAVLFAMLFPMAGVEAQPSPFQRTWERTDQPVASGRANRTWMWGPQAFTGVLTENYTEAPGGKREVIYYDKSRMEITNPSGDKTSIWYVTNGLLTTELITGQMQVGHADFEQRSPATVNVAGDGDDPTGPTYATFTSLMDRDAAAVGSVITQRVNRQGIVTTDPSLAGHGVTVAVVDDVTHHAIAAPFWEFMNATGIVYENGNYISARLFENPYFATGRPITEPYWARVKVAGTYTDVLLQCFERRCLTYTPENPEGWQVEAGNVGQHYCEWRYGAPCHTGQPPQPGAPGPSTPGAPGSPATRNCEDFATQEEAQAYFKSKGGSPSNNVDGLDKDGDGIVCEHLPSSNPPPPPPPPTPTPTPTPRPEPPTPSHPGGATALCKDGTYSHSQKASGTCSGHGGVAVWINKPN